MLAVVYHGRNDVRVEEWTSPPPPPPGWVTVSVSLCGICGTDLEEIVSGPTVIPTSPHPVGGASVPLILGHEGTGRVVAAGAGAGLALGTRVGMENTIPCTTCTACRDDTHTPCQQGATIGLNAHGALAEAVNVPASMCVPLPEGLSDEAGAIAEPLSVAVRAERRAGGVRGKDVAIVGAGTIGLLLAFVCRAGGARTITLRESAPARRDRAARSGFLAVGADEPVCPTAGVVFECSGTAAGLASAIASAATMGVIVVIGVVHGPQPVDFVDLLLRQQTIVTSVSHSVDLDYRPAVQLLADGAIDVDAIVTARVPIARAVEDGFRELQQDPGKNLKVLIDCRA